VLAGAHVARPRLISALVHGMLTPGVLTLVMAFLSGRRVLFPVAAVIIAGALLVLLVVAGLGMLVLGSTLLVEAAIAVARAIGVSELVVGLTIVAAGTSLPEVATSIMATIRGERDIAIGNVVGSNTFNILAVLGASSLVAREPLAVAPSVLAFDLPVMTAVALACFPVFFTGRRIARWEGVVFLGYYVAYTAYLILSAQHHDELPLLSMTMLYFVVPLTLITLVVGLQRDVRSGPPAGKTGR